MPTVLITGANRGIGLEFARQYSVDGWEVIATARDPDGANDLKQLNTRVEQLELRDFNAVTGFGSRIGDRLDLLIANAGTMEPAEAESAESGHGWAEMLMTNTIAPYLLAKAVLNPIAAVPGKLIALTSGMGSIAESSGGYVPYRSSKAALNMAWQSLAIEARKLGVVAAVIDPGWVKTRMGGRNAPTRPEDSVADMRRLIERLGPDESGGFFKRDGSRHAW
jgi:NAD(P)-dependent dehydrogenase (short-subunit alcohol dehydrogenase family)